MVPRRSSEPVEMREIEGTVGCYDRLKGFGFIAADDASGQVLLHVTVLRAVGLQRIEAGAYVRCLASKRPLGWQAFRLLSIDGIPVVHPGVAAVEAGWQRAWVKHIYEMRGVLLTRGAGTPDIYAREETMRNYGLAGCQLNDALQIRWMFVHPMVVSAEFRRDDASLSAV
jgi:CspA family cold shock protein